MSDQPMVEQVMTRDPATVAPNDPIRAAIERMRERKCRRLPVLEDGKLVGIVTETDLLNYLIRVLEGQT